MPRDYVGVWKAQQAVAKLANEKLPNGISLIPDELLPPQGTLGFRVQLYGMIHSGGKTKKGLTLIYDVVRRFAQPLGIYLDTWEGRIIETKKGIVRLLHVRERAETFLGEDGASGAADLIERNGGGPLQVVTLRQGA